MVAAAADDDTASAGTAVPLVLAGAPQADKDVARANTGRMSVRSNLFKNGPPVKHAAKVTSPAPWNLPLIYPP